MKRKRQYKKKDTKKRKEDFILYNNRIYFEKKNTKRDWGNSKSSWISFTKRQRHYWTLMVTKNTFGISIERNQRKKIKENIRQNKVDVSVTELSYSIH